MPLQAVQVHSRSNPIQWGRSCVLAENCEEPSGFLRLKGMRGLPFNHPKNLFRDFSVLFFSPDEAATKVPLATVYQKHRSLLTRDEDV